MTNGNGAYKFAIDCFILDIYGSLVIYAVMLIDTTICFIFLLYTNEWRNYTLSILLTSI